MSVSLRLKFFLKKLNLAVARLIYFVITLRHQFTLNRKTMRFLKNLSCFDEYQSFVDKFNPTYFSLTNYS